MERSRQAQCLCFLDSSLGPRGAVAQLFYAEPSLEFRCPKFEKSSLFTLPAGVTEARKRKPVPAESYRTSCPKGGGEKSPRAEPEAAALRGC